MNGYGYWIPFITRFVIIIIIILCTEYDTIVVDESDFHLENFQMFTKNCKFVGCKSLKKK